MTPAPFVGLLAELTHRCPLSCAYCSNPLALVGRGGELSTEAWGRVFEQAAAGGALQVHLSGGEPAARRDLEALVALAREAGLYSNLITSGVGLTRARLDACAAAGLDHVQLSVQAATAARSEALAGAAGSFARKADVAAWARALGLPLTLNVVLHRGNLEDVDAFVELAASWGARRLELAHVQLTGWAWRNRRALVASEAQMRRAVERIEAARVEAAVGRAAVAIEHVRSDVHASRPKRCMGGWGALFVVVAPDGRVLPCHGASELPLAFPTVRQVTLQEAWRSEPFERFRRPEALDAPCAGCPERHEDGGGCRCQAFAATGRLTGTDPACDLAPTHRALTVLRAPGARPAPRPRAAPPRDGRAAARRDAPAGEA